MIAKNTHFQHNCQLLPELFEFLDEILEVQVLLYVLDDKKPRHIQTHPFDTMPQLFDISPEKI